MANKTRERAMEKIVELLWEEFENEPLAFGGQEKANKAADRILALFESLGYVRISDDQSLPKPSIYVPSESDCEINEVNLISRHYYLTGQQDILKANFVKIEKE